MLADETDERYQADLGIDVEACPANADADENQRSAEGHGHADEHNYRVAEAFKQCGQGEENDDQREGERGQQCA